MDECKQLSTVLVATLFVTKLIFAAASWNNRRRHRLPPVVKALKAPSLILIFLNPNFLLLIFLLMFSPLSSKTCRCDVFDMHNELVPYAKAWSWQKSIVEERKELTNNDEDFSDSVIVLQHPPVYTLGTASSEDHLKGIKNFYRTDRGGEVTYHGPGQLVLYPILNLRYHTMDLHWYLRALEEVVMRVLSSTFSIKASRHKGLTGVWVGDRKVAAIGVRASKWITYHGLAVNVTADLTPFDQIVPCGIQDRQVGSIKELLLESVPSKEWDKVQYLDSELVNTTYESLMEKFCEVFSVQLCIKPIPSLIIPEKKSSPVNF